MSEGSNDEQTAKLLKRANEENDAVQAAKRIKAEGEHTEDEKRYPKKKVVLLLAYSGKGYYGMQVHDAVPLSVPSTLFDCVLLSLFFVCFREILEHPSLRL